MSAPPTSVTDAQLPALAVVGGMIVGEFIGDFCDRPENDVELSTALIGECLRAEQARIDALIDGGGTEEANAIRGTMQDLMTAKVGIFRTGEATMFSWDVSAQKARTAVFFSNSQLAQSSRTVGFLAQAVLALAIFKVL